MFFMCLDLLLIPVTFSPEVAHRKDKGNVVYGLTIITQIMFLSFLVASPKSASPLWQQLLVTLLFRAPSSELSRCTDLFINPILIRVFNSYWSLASMRSVTLERRTIQVESQFVRMQL